MMLASSEDPTQVHALFRQQERRMQKYFFFNRAMLTNYSETTGWNSKNQPTKKKNLKKTKPKKHTKQTP